MGDIDKHVSHQLSIFAPNHRWSQRIFHISHQRNGDLGTGGGGNQYSCQPLNIVAKLPWIAYVDRVTLSAFDGIANVLAPDSRLYNLLHISDGQTITGCFLPVNLEIKIVASHHSFCESTARTGYVLEDILNLNGNLLDLLQIGAEDLDSEITAHAGGQHLGPSLNGHPPDVGHPWKFQLGIHLLNQLLPRLGALLGPNGSEYGLDPVWHPTGVPAFLMHPFPVFLRLQKHHGFNHAQRSGISGCIGSSDLSKNPLHFGELAQKFVLCLKDPGGFRDRHSGDRSGHKKQGPFI